jgi:hypothetical protein
MPKMRYLPGGRASGRNRRTRRGFVWAALALVLLGAVVLPARAKDTPCVFQGVDRIVAVGDLHGDYQNFTKILTAVGLTDENLHWTGGKTHLVQIGDVLDRGPSARKIFDLLIRLETEAGQAGGQVHALIGNHEEMALTGISFDYPDLVTVEQFRSFLPDDYVAKKNEEYINKLREARPPEEGPISVNYADLQDYWKGIRDKDPAARREYFANLRKLYGRWILGHNAVIKINDIVFVHGGISERFSLMSLEDINDTLRRELEWAGRGVSFQPKVVYAPDGPLWYRDLARSDEKTMDKDVTRILSNLKAHHMVVGHTPHNFGALGRMERFGGRIYAIDTGISSYYKGGYRSALIIDRGKFTIWGVQNGTD